MSCCKPCPIIVTDVSVADCVATLTVEDGAITDLCQGRDYILRIQTCVSNQFSGYAVEVTDGHTTKPILCEVGDVCRVQGQNWRPDFINARSQLYVRNGNDPDAFILRGVSKRGCR